MTSSNGDRGVRAGSTGIAEKGRLLARPSRNAAGGSVGLHSLETDEQGRAGFLYVPSSYRPDTPAPLALMLHGAGGKGEHNIEFLQTLSDETGMILVSPDSRGQSWDIMKSGFGPDVTFIERTLQEVFRRYSVDRRKLAIGGFSDGASYALSLGLTNGDLFSHVIAFSPGFMAPGARTAAPLIFVSHGTKDTILPIDRCSRRIVPQLRRAGYTVRFDEFYGPHTVPPQVARAGVEWFIGRGTKVREP